MNIEFKKITKSYKEKLIFNNQKLSINLKSNSILLVRGENGSGKSTLLKLIAGILLADEFEVESKDVSNYMKWCKEYCYYLSANERGLTYKLTGKENIYYLCSLKGSSKDQIRKNLKYYSSKFNAEQILDSKVEAMSTGQKKKIQLLAALCSEAKLLLLDEPSVGLDRNNLNMLVELVDEISKNSNRKLIIVSHDKVFLDQIESINKQIKNIEIKKGGYIS